MKKIIIAALALAGAFMTVETQAKEINSLLVNLADGKTIEYVFIDEPVATFRGTDVVITNLDEIEVSYPMAEVANFTFKKEVGVNAFREGRADLRVNVSRDMISVEGLAAGATLSLYDTSGRIVATATSDGEGFASISTSRFADGVYVASAASHSFKFIKK